MGATRQLANLIPDLLNEEHQTDGYRYESFKRNYYNAPDRFAAECIDWPVGQGPTDYQKEILAYLPRMKRVAARGPHGLGKSTICAIALHWFALTRDGSDWKVATTASVWRQLIQYLWPEVHKWSRRIRWEVVGREPYNTTRELFSLKLVLETGAAFAVASDTPDQIEGAHADQMFYIFDESKIVPDPTWDSVEGAMSTGQTNGRGCYWMAVSTPGDPVGRFYDIQTRQPGYEDWWVRHVTLREAIDARRIEPEWAEQRKKQWGAQSSMYQNRVEGEFANISEEATIPAAWVDAAMQRGIEYGEKLEAFAKEVPALVTHVGIDIARAGGDQTVYFPRVGHICLPPTMRGGQDTMQTTGEVVNMVRLFKNAVFILDIIGVGAGVFDRTNEVFSETKEALQLYPFIASAKTDWTDFSEQLHFVDTRSAAWWNMRQLLDPAYDSNVVLPYNRDLRSELVAPTFKSYSDGRIKVEAKEDIRRRLGRSTNIADALIMSFWDEVFLVGMEWA